MPFKTIIVPYGGHNHETTAMETAFRLGQRFNAHVEVWHIVSDLLEIFESYSAFTPISESQRSHALVVAKGARESEKKARKKFLDVVRKYERKVNSNGRDGPSFSFHTASGLMEDVIGARGRIADLIVMCRPNLQSDRLFAGVITSIIHSSRRPLLLLPKGMKASDLDGDALIAWNGSAEAGNALQSSLPFLTKKAWIVSSQPKRHSEIPIPSGEDLEGYLTRHNVNAETSLHNVNNAEASSIISDQAEKRSVSLVVMGLYSHSRLREMIFGGVTDLMISNAKFPLLLAA